MIASLSLGRWWKRRRDQAALRKLNTMLDEAAVDAIVSAIGGYIAHRPMRYSTETDLPYPRIAIEMAFVKGISQCPPDDPRLGALRSVYITLDDFFLTPNEASVMNRYHAFFSAKDHAERSAADLAAAYNKLGASEALEIMRRLTEKMHRRSEELDQMIR